MDSKQFDQIMDVKKDMNKMQKRLLDSLQYLDGGVFDDIDLLNIVDCFEIVLTNHVIWKIGGKNKIKYSELMTLIQNMQSDFNRFLHIYAEFDRTEAELNKDRKESKIGA